VGQITRQKCVSLGKMGGVGNSKSFGWMEFQKYIPLFKSSYGKVNLEVDLFNHPVE
jgi:hypothetical protein